MENEVNPNIPKFELEKEGKNLKLFFFTIQFGQVQLNVAEDFQATFAYKKEDALAEVKKIYPNIPIIIKERANVDVKKILDVVGHAPKQNLEMKIAPAPSREKTIQDFIWGVMLIADEYVKDEKDRKTLKDVLKKIEVKNEDSISE